MAVPSEIEIDEKLVRCLLAEQHPDLADLPLSRVDAGWDNMIWRLGDALAVRLPRGATAACLTDKELRWLPEIAPTLPLPVPVAVRMGEPGCGYPWRWAVVPWLTGEPADREPITDGQSAIVLARFLRALHQPAPDNAPSNPSRGSAPLSDQSGDFERHLRAASHLIDVNLARHIWDDAVNAEPWPHPPVWLHADLHPANVMVTAGTLSGVLDFGDMCAGDPANDIAAVWNLLPANALATFLDVYGDIDDAMRARARGWALRCGVSLISIGLAGQRGLAGGKRSWMRGGTATIKNLNAR